MDCHRGWESVSRILALAAVAGAAVLSHASEVGGQTVEGLVTEEGSARPLAGADIRLLDRDRGLVARAMADSAGLYTIRADEAGHYYLVVDMIGFRQLETPLFDLRDDATLRASFELPTDAIELEGLRVEADRLEEIRREVSGFGLRIDDIGERFVGRDRIEERLGVANFGKVLQWQSIPQMRIIDGTDSGGPPRVCVMLRLHRERCALTVLNGSLVTLEAAAMVPPEAVQAIVVMEPEEATIFWGTDGGGGAVLIFTGR